MARPKSDIDARIVEAARARFLSDGVDGASLRSIAQDAGTNVGMIYYYFPTKDDLFLAVVEDAYGKVLEHLEAALREEVPTIERFRLLYRRLAAITPVEFDVIRIVMREALISSTRLKQIFARFQSGHLPLLLAAMSNGYREGEFDAGHPMPAVIATLVATAVMPQVVLRRLSSELPMVAGLLPQPEQLAAAIFEVVMRGATPRTEP